MNKDYALPQKIYFQLLKREKGINKISFMDAIKICKRFKVSLNWLAGLGE